MKKMYRVRKLLPNIRDYFHCEACGATTSRRDMHRIDLLLKSDCVLPTHELTLSLTHLCPDCYNDYKTARATPETKGPRK